MPIHTNGNTLGAQLARDWVFRRKSEWCRDKLRKLKLKALAEQPSVAPSFHNERIENGDAGLKRVAQSTERRGWTEEPEGRIPNR